jgi:hypothetical protein
VFILSELKDVHARHCTVDRRSVARRDRLVGFDGYWR